MFSFGRLVCWASALAVALTLTPLTCAQCIVQELHGDDSVQLEGYGAGVSSAGDVLAIGDARGLEFPGRVWVYRRVEGIWTLETILDDPLQDVDSYFHGPITNGEIIMVSAQGFFGEGYSGLVHVYRHDGKQWNYEALLRPPEGSQVFDFGFARAIQGDLAVITARRTDLPGAAQAGSAYVYRYDRAAHLWRQEQTLYAFSPAFNENFGVSVDLLGDRTIVGANGVDQARGAAYIFRHDGNRWVGEAELTAFDGQPNDSFGWGVSLSADLVGVGAISGPTIYGQSTGAAYLYRYRNGRWVFEAKPEPASAPSAPSMWYGVPTRATPDGRVVIVGAPGESFGAFSAGAGYLFRQVGAVWTQTAKIGDPSPNPSGQFVPGLTNRDQLFAGAFHGGVAGNGVVFVWNGVHQRDCDGDGIVDACEGVSGPAWQVTPAACHELADLDSDGVVGPLDLEALLTAWGPCAAGCLPDLDADGVVTGFDLGYLLAAWGPIASR